MNSALPLPAASHVGVISVSPGVPTELIKRSALFFDRIVPCHRLIQMRGEGKLATFFRDATEEETFRTRRAEMLWLIEQQVVLDPGSLAIDAPPTEEEIALRAEFETAYRPLDAATPIGSVKRPRELAAVLLDFADGVADLDVRCVAAKLKRGGYQAMPVLMTEQNETSSAVVTKADVLQLVIDKLPSPSEHAAWEDILAFRSDPDAVRSLRNLRVWLSDVARGRHTAAEAEEKLEALLAKYGEHLRLHRLEGSTSAFGSLTAIAVDVGEHLLNLKLGSAVRALFSARQKRITLMRSELTAPGHEVAYIHKARERFR